MNGSIRMKGLLGAGATVLAVALTAAPGAMGQGSDGSCSNASVRADQNAGYLPECRAYELVSPPDKNGHDVRKTFSSLRVTGSGNRLTYTGFGSFPGEDIPGSVWMSRFMADRGVGGWSSRSIDSRQSSQVLSFASFGEQYQNIQTPESFNSSLTVSTEQSIGVSRDPAHPVSADAAVLYRRDYSDGSYRLLSVPSGPLMHYFFTGVPNFVAGTPDRDHLVFEAEHNLTPEATGVGVNHLYEWDHGVVRYVGIRPDAEGGGPFPEGAAGAAGTTFNIGYNATNQWRGARPGVISDDGSRIFFISGWQERAGRLFMREDNGSPQARTVWISETEHSSPDPVSAPATFWAADPSGSKVLFSSAEQLVDEDTDSTQDLYQYDFARPSGDRLRVISADAEPVDGAGADFLGVLGATGDQRVVYFVAHGQLVAGAPADPGRKVYRWEDGTLRFVASLSVDDVVQFNDRDGENLASTRDYQSKVARVSENGRYLLFRTVRQVTGYDNGGFSEFYLFDSQAPEGEGVSCVSCRRDGGPSTGGVPTAYRDAVTYHTPYQPRLMTVDGDGAVRVFFESLESLVARDSNGRRDVYVYDHSSGEASLLSSGRDAYDSYLMDASADGDDVLIATRDRLVGGDRDSLYDIYDVRVGGGFAEPQPPATCDGDACQGAPSGAPAGTATASQALASAGNARARPRAEISLRAPTAAQRRRLALGQRIALTVRVNRAGMVRVTGRARVRGRLVTVVRGSRRVVAAGSAKVALRLSGAGVRRLASGRRLAVVLTARTPGDARTLRLDLRRPR